MRLRPLTSFFQLSRSPLLSGRAVLRGAERSGFNACPEITLTPARLSSLTSILAPAVSALASAGFRLESVSRVPYLSDGDTRCPVYSLDDALIVLSVPPEGESADDGAA